MTADDSNAADAPEPASPASEPEPVGEAAEQRCWNCGSPLPDGAMFCGECGSAVGARATRPVEQAPAADEAGPAGPAAESEAAPVLTSESEEAALPPHGDQVLETTGGEEPAEQPTGANDARAELSTDADQSGLPPHGDPVLAPSDAADDAGHEPQEPASTASSAAGDDAPNVPPADAADDEEDFDAADGEGAASGEDSDGGGRDNAATAVQPVLEDDESGIPPHGDPGATRIGFAAGVVSAERQQDDVDGTGNDEPGDDSDGREPDGPDLLAPLTPEERLAAERLLDPDSQADKFVLQFSTGESATVYGSGLVGRNPVAEPGEYVDHFVVIRDPGRSVSKTHLEFGQDRGAFWVLDRFSGNGSVLREPEGAPRRCEPGRRYFVPRGTRIEIGDQFFVVS